MIYLYVIFYSFLLVIVNELLNKKLKVKEIQREVQEKIKDLEKISENEIIELYKKQMKIFQINLIINTILIIIYFISLQPFEIIQTKENYTEVYIRNPLLKYSNFYIDSQEIKGIFSSQNGIIILPKLEKLKIEPAILIFPFNLPIINKNWLGVIGSFILLSLLTNLIITIIKALIRFLRLEIKNG